MFAAAAVVFASLWTGIAGVAGSVGVWCTGAWATVGPLIPGVLVFAGWSYGSHLIAFGGSWWAASSYSVNCVGTGLSGMYQAYWRLGSATCTSLLFTHAILLAAAIASIISTLAIFAWVWYRYFTRMIAPMVECVRSDADHVARVVRETATSPGPYDETGGADRGRGGGRAAHNSRGRGTHGRGVTMFG